MPAGSYIGEVADLILDTFNWNTGLDNQLDHDEPADGLPDEIVVIPSSLLGTVSSHGQALAQPDIAELQSLSVWAGLHWQLPHAERQVVDYEIRIADLPGRLLGVTDGRLITIDANAAGLGWFVDATPWDRSEFGIDNGIGKRYDLLSVLVHELGHVLGHDHADEGVMAGVLRPGERSLTHQADKHLLPHDQIPVPDRIGTKRLLKSMAGIPKTESIAAHQEHVLIAASHQVEAPVSDLLDLQSKTTIGDRAFAEYRTHLAGIAIKPEAEVFDQLFAAWKDQPLGDDLVVLVRLDGLARY